MICKWIYFKISNSSYVSHRWFQVLLFNISISIYQVITSNPNNVHTDSRF